MPPPMSFGGAALHFRRAAAAIKDNTSVLRRGAAILQAEARGMLGTYQAGYGGIAGWTPLHPETILSRTARGWDPEDPLDVTGALGRAIEADAGPDMGAIGVRSAIVGEGGFRDPKRDIAKVAISMEMGNHESNTPPRSFLALAGARRGEEVAALIGAAIANKIANGGVDD